ncbi:MAG TPA: hypothetical protein VGN63_12940 [Flavisolibacter sp.]|jgi:hypothetical protein|nr:hypothetical protein [Flavisolibacter sp.]
MKKLTFLLLPFLFFAASAQTSTDAQLNKRLKTYMALSKELDFAGVMNYMHPRIFTIVPKEQLVQTMETAFNTPGMKITFDSMAVVAISPIYKTGSANYRKVDYYMSMNIALNDSMDLADKQIADVMLASFRQGFPGKKITVQTATNSIQVSGKELMFAIKDAQAPEWLFLGYDRSNPKLAQQLYPKQVRQHFKLL